MNVSVDEHFARFGSKSIPIAKISGIEIRARRPNSRAPMVLFTLAGLFCFAWGASGGSAGIPLAIVFAILAVVMWRHARVTEYLLIVTASGSDVQATRSRDFARIDALRREIEQRICDCS